MNSRRSELKKVPPYLERYLQWDIQIVPLEEDRSSKKPLIKIKDQEGLKTVKEVEGWLPKTDRFAIRCGEVSGYLVGIDIDKEEVFSALNLGVVAARTYTEERTTEDGSKRYHILIRTTKPILTKQLKFDEKEEISIRGENSLLVAGGTPYASGSAYEHFITSPKKIAAVDPGFFNALEKLWNDYHGLGEKGGKSFSKLIKSVTLKTDILSVIRQCVESEGKKLEDYTDNGDYCQCRCPLPHHTDLQPSFTIYKKTNSYYCFGCSKGGNVITFLKEFYGFTIGEAVNRLKETGAIKEENEERFKRKAHFEKGGRLYLEILTRDEQYKYAHLNDSDDVELIDGVDDILPVELPVTKEGELALIVKMPDENVASSTLLSPVKLLENPNSSDFRG